LAVLTSLLAANLVIIYLKVFLSSALAFFLLYISKRPYSFKIFVAFLAPSLFGNSHPASVSPVFL